VGMSEDKKLCPKCNAMTMEPDVDCVLQQPSATNIGFKVMPFHCPKCRYVELYSTAPLIKTMDIDKLAKPGFQTKAV
jgi:predicted nucleic-acid-binding Zn-ribbon protein